MQNAVYAVLSMDAQISNSYYEQYIERKQNEIAKLNMQISCMLVNAILYKYIYSNVKLHTNPYIKAIRNLRNQVHMLTRDINRAIEKIIMPVCLQYAIVPDNDLPF